jgi:hypothetical protein
MLQTKMRHPKRTDARADHRDELRGSAGMVLPLNLPRDQVPFAAATAIAQVNTTVEGVALILDIDSQSARTGLRSGRSVRAITGPHRSLRAEGS